MSDGPGGEAGEEVPDSEGPDPRTWRGSDRIWQHAENVIAADEMLRILSGETPQDGMSESWGEARDLVRLIAATSREHLAVALLDAYGALPPPDPVEGPPA